MEMSNQFHALAALPPKKGTPMYPLGRRLDGLQNQCGHGGKGRGGGLPLPQIDPCSSSQ